MTMEPQGDMGRPSQVGKRVAGRYTIEGIIGAGGMGAVLAGHDTLLDRAVAIKRLNLDGARDERATERLLQEGRDLARLNHDAIVRIFDTGTDPELGPFLVMERLDGVDLSRFLRDQGVVAPWLAVALVRQIAEGLQVVHEAGVLHHDLKPSNVFLLRLPHGHVPRVKVLDFGVATSFDREDEPTESADNACGTLAYMAPERLRKGEPVDARSDVYSVAAILYELLSGASPFQAGTRAALRLAIAYDQPPSLAVRCPDLPAWLVAVVECGLTKLPEARYPSMRAFAEALGPAGGPAPRADPATSPIAAEASAIPWASTDGPTPRLSGGARRVFLGRHDVLDALDHVVSEAALGTPRVVFIEGTSGIGKSTLLARFKDHLEGRGGALVLSSRARRADSVPFPAIEEAIAELGAHLLALPSQVAEAMLSKRSGALGQLFPSLLRVPAIASALAARSEPQDEPLLNRRRAAVLLRELFGRLCDRTTVVLMIDDVQWIDSDSRTVLGELLAGEEPPPLVVVGAVREDGVGGPTSELLKLRAGLPVAAVTLTLGPLSMAESRALLRARWGGETPPDEPTANDLARQSGGVPFFVEMLAASADPVAFGGARELDGVLGFRHRALPPAARRALEIICVSSRPLPARLLMAAAEIPNPTALDPLLIGCFARSVRTGDGWSLEPYHNKIREAALDGLSLDERRDNHRALARLLRRDAEADPETLVEHLAGCGDSASAAQVALAAAHAASAQLAFDRAASLIEVALRHGHADDKLAIRRWHARVLHDAGRRREASSVLELAATEVADPNVQSALLREAGAHLLLSGDVARGLAVLRPALHELALEVPVDFAATVAATTDALGALAARGLVPAVPGAGATEAAFGRIDLCLVLAQGLAHIDLRVLPFACQAFLAALDAGEPGRLQRAAALFVINAVEYAPNPMVAPALELCRRLTAESSEPLAAAMFAAALAENAHFQGDFLAAEAAFERAERILLESCPGATRELATVRDIAVFIQYAQKGDFRTQLERTERWLAQADANKDVFHASMLRVAHGIVWIAKDQPERARSELHAAQAEWSGDGGVLEVAAALYHDIIDRYQERDLLPAGSDDMRSSLLRSPAAQTPFLSGYLGLQRAWAELRAMAEGRARGSEAQAVRDTIAKMRQLGLGLWRAVGSALEGNLLFLEDAREEGIRALDDAEGAFRRLHMLCLAACARQRRGQMMGGELGSRLEREGDRELGTLGVVNPPRWSRAYWSMFDITAHRLRTRDDGAELGADADP